VSTVIPSPATVEVVRHAFMSGAEQMRRNLYRSAYSPVIYEMKDCSVGIYDARGALLGQAPGLPFFLGSLGGTIEEVIRRKGPDAFAEGDVWLVNDSAICGSHLNDVTVFAPIFTSGVLRGFSGAKAHWNDVGAKEAGYVSDSTDIFQEGLRLPPLRIVKRASRDRWSATCTRRTPPAGPARSASARSSSATAGPRSRRRSRRSSPRPRRPTGPRWPRSPTAGTGPRGSWTTTASTASRCGSPWR
jgi:hypothetical protein